MSVGSAQPVGGTPIAQQLAGLDTATAGAEMQALASRLYPICRSITGDGVRETLAILSERIPLEVVEVPSGREIFDWVVPKEWNLRQAWIADSSGRRIVDAADHNLHLLNYSVPFRGQRSLRDLDEHLYSLPEQPDLIPYRTSYYSERWGFCLSHRQRLSLEEDTYQVVVDTTLEPGHLTYGELYLPGETEREFLLSCHVCHPSLANDNLSGIAVCAFLAEILSRVEKTWSYRFLFVPGTIGAITWLANNPEAAERVDAGLVAANLGDGGAFHYKRSWHGDAIVDRVVRQALGDLGVELEIEDFVPYGYDERQYASPAFRLPVGSLTRTPYGRYPEYHTSADNLDFLRPESLGGSLAAYLAVAAEIDGACRYRSTNPACEPQLGKRGLYATLGGESEGKQRQLTLLWVLNLADGDHSLRDIAERSKLPPAEIEAAADMLLEAGLLTEG